MRDLEVRESDGALLLKVAARPGASRSALRGVHAGALKVAIGAPPDKGKANKELVAFLAKTLGIKKAQLTLVAGQASRAKTVRVEGLKRAELLAKLARSLGYAER